jgi:outer membrane protein assembly factor BamB
MMGSFSKPRAFAIVATLIATFAQTVAVAQELPTSRMLARFGMERAWWSQATMNIRRDHANHVTLDEDMLFVQSTGGMITAFDAETGQKKWARQLGVQDAPNYAAASNNKLVLVIAGMTLFCINKADGEELWTLSLPNQPSTSPVMDRKQVYYGTLDGSVFAFDLKMIRKLHDEGKLPQYTSTALAWRYKTAKEVTSKPLVSELLVHFGSRDNSLYTVTALERKLQWQFETLKPISAPLGWHGGYIFLASEDFNVFCIDQTTGSIRWQFIAGLPIRRQPRIVGNDVFIFPDRGGMHCVSKITGRRRYWRKNIRDFIAATEHLLFVSDFVGNVVVVARKDGAILGSLPLRGFKLRYGNELTDRVYLVNRSGLTVCLRERGKEFPTYHLYPERQPILPDLAPDDAADPAADPGM